MHKLVLIKIVTTTRPFKMILIFIDTLHVTLFQKNSFTFTLAQVLLILNLFLNCIQNERFMSNFNEFASKLRKITLNALTCFN